jgi:hypothetical protein
MVARPIILGAFLVPSWHWPMPAPCVEPWAEAEDALDILAEPGASLRSQGRSSRPLPAFVSFYERTRRL